MTLRNAKDFWSGVLFAAVGLFFIVTVQKLRLGTAARMGPAYFPTILGGLLTLLGLLLVVRGFLSRISLTTADAHRVEPFHWRILTLILGSVLVFSFLLNTCGVLLAVGAMIFISACAEKKVHWKETLAVVVVLDAIVWVTFVYGIGMQIPVWPSFS